ncbi:MAG: DUF1365 family protein [Deltaproteobacteria bacterium]|nr:DUF1365 family protein [Deltaproteobacteria bacterium]
MFDPEKIYLAEGETTHHRYQPKPNKFTYKHDYIMFEVSRVSDLEKLWFFKLNKFNFFSIKYSDYFFGKNVPIRDQLETFFCERLSRRFDADSIFCLTTPRVLGFAFNPVNFYFCFAQARPLYFLAEVNNTFWERYIYFEDLTDSARHYFTWRKDFFVSPFFPRDGEYLVFVKLSPTIYIQFVYYFKGQKVFTADYRASLRPLNKRSQLVIIFLSRPTMFWLTTLKIYSQALNLWLLKKLTVVSKPSPKGLQLVWARPYMISTQILQARLTKKLRNIKKGRLKLVYPDGLEEEHNGQQEGYSATIKINDFKLFWRLALEGQIGFFDAFVEELWDSDCPAELVSLLLDNWDVFASAETGSLVYRLLYWAAQLVRHNSQSNSVKNISFHYDKPVSYYKLFLDNSLTYSCAFFEGGNDDLDHAQINKLRCACDELEIKSDDNVLEIGSGFGSFAVYAAKTFGCKVTTITISKVQFDYVCELVKKENLTDLVTVKLCDYRAIDGKFDKIVSIEMIEAVGDRYLRDFFSKLDSLLKHGGKILLQAITYPDFDYFRYLKRADWIQTRIFPGSCLPSLFAIQKALLDTGLVIDLIYNRSGDYAKTLKTWYDRLKSNQKSALEYVSPKELRQWLLYFAICQAEFQTDWLRLLRLILKRPNERRLFHC